MNSLKIDANTDGNNRSILAVLFPRPSPFARALFRCLLFAWIPILAVVPPALIGRVEPLLEAVLPLAALLAPPTFALSFAFLRTDWRLAIIGFGVLLLILVLGLAFPTYAA
jgi:hypothetical protein